MSHCEGWGHANRLFFGSFRQPAVSSRGMEKVVVEPSNLLAALTGKASSTPGLTSHVAHSNSIKLCAFEGTDRSPARAPIVNSSVPL